MTRGGWRSWSDRALLGIVVALVAALVALGWGRRVVDERWVSVVLAVAAIGAGVVAVALLLHLAGRWDARRDDSER